MGFLRVVGFSSIVFLVVIAGTKTSSFASFGGHVIANYHLEPSTETRSVKRAGEFGIKEIVPNDVRQRYQKWKDALLSTEYGRAQWEYYSNNKNFLLRIVVSDERKF